MPSARELLEQADVLMQRNRTRVIDTLTDTEIPELTEIVAMVAAPAAAPVSVASSLPPAAAASAGAATPTDLDDVPELTEAVEEIEIESIVELPEDLDESSGWLHHEHVPLGVVGGGPSSLAPGFANKDHVALNVERAARSALSVVGKGMDTATPTVATAPQVTGPVETPGAAPVATPAEASPATGAAAHATSAVSSPSAPTPAAEPPATADEWARWEVLADEIRMQVLQRIDIFTDTRLRDQLAAQLQPIVDRASAEMVATINAHVGGLLRAYIAEAIEREIEKWRETAR